jgi:drug/metabolite transporter (DMT)-like permease
MSRPGRAPAVRYLLAVLVLVLGVAAVVAGGADDSPGLQLLGVLLGVGAVVGGVRTVRAARGSAGRRHSA